MRPVLKSVAWERLADDQLRLVFDVREQLLIDDPDGTVERLLELLARGGRTVAELAGELAVPVADLDAVVTALDGYGLVQDGDRRGGLDAARRERHFSNLAFFESFATLRRSQEDFTRRLARSRVLVLGTGGLNSNTVPHLCGLGVGSLVLLDRDAVEPRNFARQYLYRWDQIGQSKVDCAAQWVRQFDPAVDVTAVRAEITGAGDITGLIDRYAPDVVMSGVDRPAEVDQWVNRACTGAGVPFVRGGMGVTQGVVWSVDPGRSACLECARVNGAEMSTVDLSVAVESAGARLYRTLPRVNRGIGPVAGLLGSLCAFEVLRYLTGFEVPAYAGRLLTIDFASGCATSQVQWQRRSDCVACGSPPTGNAPGAAAAPGPRSAAAPGAKAPVSADHRLTSGRG